MKAQELRIGNWLQKAYNMYDDTNTHYTDKQCDFIDMSAMNIHDNNPTKCVNFKPIQITEERLIKFGFELMKSKVKSGAIVKNWDNGSIFDIKESKEKGYWLLRYDSIEISKFKYVHQLQNLYFALTGEELIT